MTERQCGDGCKGCMYFNKNGANGTSCCDYAYQTGKLRGCPAGEGCIRYTKGNKGKSFRKYLAVFA